MADINADIARVPTTDERREYVEIGTFTPKQKFLTELAKVEQKFVKQYMPFDGQCAKIDFSDDLERAEKESERVYGFINQKEVDKLKFTNLDKYGDESRFTVVDEQEVFEQQNINAIKTSVKTGVMIKYICKRGHGVAVFVPNDVYEKRKKGGK
jgi:hypothetical protein